MKNEKKVIKIVLLLFSVLLVIYGVSVSSGTECYDGFIILMSLFVVLYDVVLEFVL